MYVSICNISKSSIIISIFFLCSILQGQGLKYVLTVANSKKGVVQVRKPDTLRVIKKIRADYNRIQYMIASSDGSVVVTASEKKIKVLSTKTWKPIKTFIQNEYISSLAVNSEGTLIVSGGRDKVYIWDVCTGVYQVWGGYKGAVCSLDFSCTDPVVAIADEHGKVDIRQLIDGKIIKHVSCESMIFDSISKLKMSLDGHFLVVVDGKKIIVFSKEDGWDCRKRFEFKDPIDYIAFDYKSSQIVLSLKYSSQTYVWSIYNASCFEKVDVGTDFFNFLLWHRRCRIKCILEPKRLLHTAFRLKEKTLLDKFFLKIFLLEEKKDKKDPDEFERIVDLCDGLGKQGNEKDFEIKFIDNKTTKGLSKLFYL